MGNERRRGSFIKAVEVFPPVFPRTPRGESSLDLGAEQSRFVQAVEPVAGIADYVLVADLKDPSVLKLSSLHSAALLKAKLKVRAVPVITARDANRPAVTASVLTAFALGLESLFLVWGDRFGGAGDPKNVYDFRSLSEVIAEARSLADRAHVDGGWRVAG